MERPNPAEPFPYISNPKSTERAKALTFLRRREGEGLCESSIRGYPGISLRAALGCKGAGNPWMLSALVGICTERRIGSAPKKVGGNYNTTTF